MHGTGQYDFADNRDLFNSVGPTGAPGAIGGPAYFERPNLSEREAAAWEMQAQRFGSATAAQSAPMGGDDPTRFYSQPQYGRN